MEKPEGKIGKLLPVFILLCILALPLVVISAFSYEPGQGGKVAAIEAGATSFDHNGESVFKKLQRLSDTYIKGTSTERTLEEYYSHRQYPGSPPFIPHEVESADQSLVDCLACHASGGWSEALKRHTPITPHPEQTACRQCHVPMPDGKLFVANDWMSVRPPRLGRSHLPGAPPPIPHDLQMRGNCIACHVGPGAVVAIRTEHPDRGNCRQCHVPDIYPGLFHRAKAVQTSMSQGSS